MKKILAFVLSVITIVSSLFVAGISAYAKNVLTITDKNENVVYTDALSQTPVNQIIAAFNYCAENTSDTNKYTINMPAGNYNITGNIFPSDNTIFKMDENTVLINDINGRGNIFCSRKSQTKYNGLKNFSVIGGTVTYSSRNKNGSVLFRFAHCKNILVQDVKFINGYKSHFCELAACQNVKFDKCTFSGFTGNIKESSCEALQIDILEEDVHFSFMPQYDGTMNSGITVQNCKFENLIAGVGTNNLYVGYYQDKIVIKNNSFTNISGTAVNAFCYTNCNISNNTITKCGVGIRYYMMKNDDALDRASVLDSNAKINTACKSVISNNKISVISSKDVAKTSGIIVLGNNVTSKKTSVVKAGNYAVHGLKVANNNITTKEDGINVYDTCNSTFSGNTIRGTGKLGRGISLDRKSKNNTVSKNIISNFKNGIYTKNTSDLSFIGNTVSDCSSSLIAFNGENTGMSVKGNKLNNSATNGVYSSETTKVKNIKNNTMTNIKGFGCYFEKGASGYVGPNTSSKVNRGLVGIRKNSSTILSSGKVFAPVITTSKTKAGVELKWKKPTKPLTYRVYRKKSTEKSYKKIASISAGKNKFTDKKVKKQSKYYYQVVSRKKLETVTIYSSPSKTKIINF